MTSDKNNVPPRITRLLILQTREIFYKYTTCIPRGNDVETVEYTWCVFMVALY